ncbi:hypothetical protein [Kitasatospora sp. NPDC090308]|uniref:hypothetical protein n=1 Tax=Kitasatospora sp. NPDC090308 TaxID=3364082 RepID=UPI00381A6901
MDGAWSGNRDPHRLGTVLTFDDGSGASLIEVTVQHTADRIDQLGCLDAFQTLTDSCARTVLPDGPLLVIDKLRSRITDGGLEWRAFWAASDGHRVHVAESSGEPIQMRRLTPPLTNAQLTAMVTAPQRGEVFAALTRVTGARTPPSWRAPTRRRPPPRPRTLC